MRYIYITAQCVGGGFFIYGNFDFGDREEDISRRKKTVRNPPDVFYLCSSAKSDGEKVFSGEWLIALFTLAAMNIVFDCLK